MSTGFVQNPPNVGRRRGAFCLYPGEPPLAAAASRKHTSVSMGFVTGMLSGMMRRNIDPVAQLAGLDIKAKRPAYVGRDEAASPATGLARIHQQQQDALVRAALGL